MLNNFLVELCIALLKYQLFFHLTFLLSCINHQHVSHASNNGKWCLILMGVQ